MPAWPFLPSHTSTESLHLNSPSIYGGPSVTAPSLLPLASLTSALLSAEMLKKDGIDEEGEFSPNGVSQAFNTQLRT